MSWACGAPSGPFERLVGHVKKFVSRLLDIGSMPAILLVTVLLLIAVAVIAPFVESETADAIFRPLVLAVLLEVFLLLGGIARTVSDIDQRTAAQEDEFSLLAPPFVTGPSLIEKLEATGRGELKIICYGTNRFGSVLDTVRARFPNVKTEVVVCALDRVISRPDVDAIEDLIEELAPANNITVRHGSTMPTVRAALLRDADGTPVWASVSFYLIYMNKRRRGLKSEGVSPVLMSDTPGSRPMRIISEFIDDEYLRLLEPLSKQETGSNP